MVHEMRGEETARKIDHITDLDIQVKDALEATNLVLQRSPLRTQEPEIFKPAFTVPLDSDDIPAEDLKRMQEVTEYRDNKDPENTGSNEELSRADRVPNESK